MAQRNIAHNNFSAGELSPSMWGRSETPYYSSGAKSISNFQPNITGGLDRRYGTFQYWAGFNASYPPLKAIPFVFNNTQSYVLYITNQASPWIIISEDGQTVVELDVSDYFDECTITQTVADDIRYAQAYDTMIITSRYFHPKKLLRNSETSWDISDVEFTIPPTAETEGYTIAEDITLAQATTGTGISVTNTGAQFLKADIGRTIKPYYATTKYIVTDCDISTDTLTFNAAMPKYAPIVFTGTNLPAGLVANTVYFTDSSADTTSKIYPTYADAVATTNAIDITDIGGGDILVDIQTSGEAQIVTLDAGNDDIATVDITEDFDTRFYGNGYYKLSGTPNCSIKLGVSTFTDDYKASKNKKGNIVPLSAGDAAFRSSDVGKYIVIATGGIFKILSYSSATLVRVKILDKQRESDRALAGEWTLEDRLWNKTTDTEYSATLDAQSYPIACAFHDQRLYFGSWADNPQGIVASKTGDYFNFGRCTDDADGFNFTLTTSQRISHIASAENLMILSDGSELTVEGTDGLITPTSIQIKTRSYNGSSNITPINVNGSVCYTSPSKRKLYISNYNGDTGRYSNRDLTKLADHITKDAYITSLTYQPEPHPIISITLSDGTFATCIYSEEDEVMGWARHKLGDSANSSAITDYANSSHICAVPNGNDYKVYMIGEMDDNIKRIIGQDFSGRVGETNHTCLTDFSMAVPPAVYIDQETVSAGSAGDELDPYADFVLLYAPFNNANATIGGYPAPTNTTYYTDITDNNQIYRGSGAPVVNSDYPLFGENTLRMHGPDPSLVAPYTPPNTASDSVYLAPNTGNWLDLGAEFSIDFWVYFSTLPQDDLPNDCHIIHDGTSTDSTLNWRVKFSSSSISIASGDGGSTVLCNVGASANMQQNTWEYYEISVKDGIAYFFKNGNLLDKAAYVTNTGYDTSSTKTIGARVQGTGPTTLVTGTLAGALAHLRVTSKARHLTDYTPPTSAPSTTPIGVLTTLLPIYDDDAVVYVANTYLCKVSELTFPWTVSQETYIGYNYKSEVELLTPEVDMGNGTSQLSSVHSNLLGFRVHDSMDFKVNGDWVSRSETNISWASEYNSEYTGDLYMENYGWDRGQHTLVITQDTPVPLSLDAVFMRFNSNIG